MKYGIVLFPSKELQDKANSYRKRFDPHYANIPPHLTLREAFESDIDVKELSKILRNIAQKHHPFQLKVIKVSSFQPITNTIFFKVEKNEEITSLHDDVLKDVPGPDPIHPFVPHVTIGQKLSNDEHSDVYNSLRMLGIEHEEIIDRFHLVYQLENESWTVYETFRLGKDSNQ